MSDLRWLVGYAALDDTGRATAFVARSEEDPLLVERGWKPVYYDTRPAPATVTVAYR